MGIFRRFQKVAGNYVTGKSPEKFLVLLTVVVVVLLPVSRFWVLIALLCFLDLLWNCYVQIFSFEKHTKTRFGCYINHIKSINVQQIMKQRSKKRHNWTASLSGYFWERLVSRIARTFVTHYIVVICIVLVVVAVADLGSVDTWMP